MDLATVLEIIKTVALLAIAAAGFYFCVLLTFMVEELRIYNQILDKFGRYNFQGWPMFDWIKRNRKR